MNESGGCDHISAEMLDCKASHFTGEVSSKSFRGFASHKFSRLCFSDPLFC